MERKNAVKKRVKNKKKHNRKTRSKRGGERGGADEMFPIELMPPETQTMLNPILKNINEEKKINVKQGEEENHENKFN